MAGYIDEHGTAIWSTDRKVIDYDPDSLVGKTAVVRVLPEKGKPVAIERQSGKPILSSKSLRNLRDIQDDLMLAKQALLDSRVGYVVIDNFGTVNRNNVNSRLRSLQTEIRDRTASRQTTDGFVVNMGPTEFEPFDESEPEAPINQVIQDIKEREGEDMQIPLDADFYRRQAAQHLATAEKLDGIPLQDPFEPGQVIGFTKSYGGQSEQYDFAAVKIDRQWCITGNEGPRNYKTWSGLLDFIGIEAFHTIAVLTCRPQDDLKSWWSRQQKAKELESKVKDVADDMAAKGQSFDLKVEGEVVGK